MRTTDDLMKKLNNTVTDEHLLNDYLKGIDKYDGNSFKEYFGILISRHGKTRAEVVRASHIERTFAEHMIGGSKKITRNNLLALCIACGCTFPETEKCLKLTGNSALYSKNKRDAIIIYAINRGLTIQEINDILYEKNLELLVIYDKERESVNKDK